MNCLKKHTFKILCLVLLSLVQMTAFAVPSFAQYCLQNTKTQITGGGVQLCRTPYPATYVNVTIPGWELKIPYTLSINGQHRDDGPLQPQISDGQYGLFEIFWMEYYQAYFTSTVMGADALCRLQSPPGASNFLRTNGHIWGTAFSSDHFAGGTIVSCATGAKPKLVSASINPAVDNAGNALPEYTDPYSKESLPYYDVVGLIVCVDNSVLIN